MGTSTFMGLYVPNWTGLTISAFVIGIILSLSAAFQPETTPYSKFGNRKVDNIPSRRAMLVIYVPSVIACLLIQRPSLDWANNQFNIIHFLSLAHFVKRVLEVLFIHIYKSNTNAEAMLSVMSAYTLTTTLDLLVVRRIPESAFCSTLTYIGVAFVVIGEMLNGYHHYCLREMRLSQTNQKKGTYSLPRGALFDYAIAPHYAAEQLTFLGLILISQNVVSLAVKFFPFIYLTVRAKETRIWYSTHLTESKNKQELSKRKNLIPFVW
ncbi:Ras modification protein ERF4 [Mucor velutinosus]|uniref:Ras modification protein ERF4 n=1 Tax=Mucor velutinosus TaxID=708070 RepID=A0AAN7DDH9_9FUNG|nr:Ras modification protein ERF4 [Mucor velutinosus]